MAYLPISHQVTKQSELPIMSRVLSDPPSHKVGHVQQHSIHQMEAIFTWLGLIRPWKHKVGFAKKWPKCSRSPLLLQCLLSPSLHLWPHGEFSIISWQKQQRFRPGLHMVLHDMQAPPESRQLQHSRSSQDITERNDEGKSSRWAELRAVHLGRICNYMLIHALWPMVWLDGQRLGRNRIEW